jgi:uncharacterized protein (DUF433 family)
VESVPGKVSGAWVLKGTRMPAEVISNNYDYGMDVPEIARAYEVDLRIAEAIVAFSEDYRRGALGRIHASPAFAALLDAAPAPPSVDWRGCAVVEWMAEPFHDTWVLRGTPTPADLLMEHHDDGWRLEDIAEHYGWDQALIAALIAYGEAYRAGVGGGPRPRA